MQYFSLSRAKARAPAALALALQGGGTFGAFTWGVLDRLLAEDGPVIDAVSGTSAGAVNAVLLADGLAEGGRPAARARLARFWERLAAWTAPGQAVLANVMLRHAPQFVSPYQFNPLGLDPLRELLAAEVDFARLRAAAPVRLLIAATRVRDGQPRLFRNAEITLETVLASACLPMLHHTVEIDGEAYWDGAFTANPPLRALVEDGAAEDLVLVELAPEERAGVPRSMPEITRRAREIAFTAPLCHELAALEDLVALCRRRRLFPPPICRRLARLRLHRIRAADAVPDLAEASPLATDRAFLHRLRDAGAAAAGAWLAEVRGAAGFRASA